MDVLCVHRCTLGLARGFSTPHLTGMPEFIWFDGENNWIFFLSAPNTKLG